MIQRFLLVAVMLGTLAGCVDTVESVSREYRNAINECVDAMMMITNETQAKEVTIRVLKPSNDKFQSLERKLKILEGNRTNFEFFKECIESDGFFLLNSEYAYNRQRFALEKTRLRKVKDEILKAHQEKQRAEGNANPDTNCCPKLDDLLKEGPPLSALETQLKNNSLMAKFDQVKTRVKEKEKPELDRIFDKKIADFNKPFQPLVN